MSVGDIGNWNESEESTSFLDSSGKRNNSSCSPLQEMHFFGVHGI